MKSGKLIVLTGPSGVGKGTLLKLLLQRHPELFLSISVTTRSPRPGEINGQHYFFIERHEFDQMITRGELLEWAEFAGNYYGTPRKAVEQHIQRGDWVILEIELLGARQIRANFPDAFQIFLLPPSLDELERRVRDRGHDSEEAIARRLKRAASEIAAADEFDLQVVNDDLDAALHQIEDALFAESPTVEFCVVG
ncbi:MAG: guanylate kinase [Synechococcales cyanobacterium T60_A2020_003]|nr:guanylate kinase [Synechococcales cyanobacterium T60_A2020_003]